MSTHPPASGRTPRARAGSDVALDQPYYGASFGIAVQRFFQKYATFSGRASRSEYWWWVLVGIIVSIVFSIATALAGGTVLDPSTGMVALSPGAAGVSVVSGVWGLATLVPGLALVWRRLHDTDRSGAWFFLIFFPIIGAIILLAFLLSGPRPEGRRFDR